MKRAFIISPYAGDVARNIAYAKRCMHHAFAAGYAPFAPHLLYTQVLDDADAKERAFGIESGHAYLESCEVALCFLDLHVSTGMRADCAAAEKLKIRIEYTSIMPGTVPRVETIHALSLPHSHMPCATCQVEQETVQ